MTNFTVTIIDHATQSEEKWRQGMLKHIQALYDQCITPNSVHRVIVRWGTANTDDNVLLHFVEDINNSYVQKEMPGEPLKPYIAGHTRIHGRKSGTEFYRLTNGQAIQNKWSGYAVIAVHESMHNLLPGWGMEELHNNGGGGLAAAVPEAPPNDRNKELLLRGFSIKGAQLQ